MIGLREKTLLAISEVHSGNGAEGERIADAALIVAAINALPELVARVRELQHVLTYIEEEAASTDGDRDIRLPLIERVARAALKGPTT
jgi:hypothetical protein